MGNLKVECLTLGVCQTNCYYIHREDSREVIFFDPADKGSFLYETLQEKEFQIKAILLTHGHFDHIWGCEELKEAANADAKERGAEPVKVYACEAERALLLDTHMNVSAQMHRPCSVEADVYVKDGDEITIAGITCKVIATPGHTEGGCCYYFAEAGILVCGDTLFQESVGRSDFPTGSGSALIRSIKEKLFPLPDDTLVYPGHGDSTTIGHEKKYNPFCV